MLTMTYAEPITCDAVDARDLVGAAYFAAVARQRRNAILIELADAIREGRQPDPRLRVELDEVETALGM